MALLVRSDVQDWKVVSDQEVGVLEYGQPSETETPVPVPQTTAIAAVIDSGPRGRTGARGPAGVVVIPATATEPPPETPVGTVVYQLIN